MQASPETAVASVSRASLPTAVRACMALIVVAILVAVPVAGNPYYITLAVNFGITLILTMSLNLVIGYSGQFCLSHAAFFGVGAYIPAILSKQFGLSAWLGLPASIAASGLLAALVGVPVVRLKGYYLAVATLSFSLFAEVVIRQGGSITGGGYGLSGLSPPEVFGTPLKGASFYLLVVVLVAIVFVSIDNVMNSRFGRSVLAVRDNAPAALATGINAAQIRLTVFILTAAFASIAGWLHTFYHRQINPILLSPEWTFVWLFMVLIGGIGHKRGVILGTLLLTVVPEFLGFATDQTILGIGVLMVLATLFAPSGLGGLLDKLQPWIATLGVRR
jgi:branched-chain amino acid transport system permease protein